MCQTSPGPRCASHTRIELRKAERELSIAREVREQAIAHRAATTGQTPDSIIAMPSVALRKVFADYDTALVAHTEAQAAHDATRTGQAVLKNAAATAKANGDYTAAQRLTHRLNQGAARHQYDLALAGIATDQRDRLTRLDPNTNRAVTTADNTLNAAHLRWEELANQPIDPADAYAQIGNNWVGEEAHDALTTYHLAIEHAHITRALAGANLPTNYRIKTVQSGQPSPVSHHNDGSTNAYRFHPAEEGLPNGYLAPLTWVPDTTLNTGYRYVDTINNETVYPVPGDPYGDIPTELVTIYRLPDTTTTALAG